MWKFILKEQSQEMEQEKFESHCNSKISPFFKKFKSESLRFNLDDKNRAREAYKWTDVENYVEQETKKNEMSKVLVR